MSNPYDAFDTPDQPTGPNPYDQFDPKTPRQIAEGVVGLTTDINKSFVQGAKATVGQQLQGIAEAIPPDEGNAFRTKAGQLILQGVPYDEAVRQASEAQSSGQLPVQSPQDTLTYKIGAGIENIGKEALTPRATTPQVVSDIASGAGSVASNIGPAMLGKAGVGVATALLPFGGSGEAAERARKAGATPQQVKEAAQYGGALAGATDLADLALLRTGFRAGKPVQQLLAKMIEGGLIEGTQEGVQQFIQNATAKIGYKPDQSLSDDVLYNAFIGAVVGAGAKPVLEPGHHEAAQPPTANPYDLIEQFTGAPGATSIDINGVTATTPGTPTAAPIETQQPPNIPPPSGPQDYGVNPYDQLPYDQLDPGPTTVATATSVPGVPIAPPNRLSRDVQIIHKDGMWNIMVNGVLDNAFGTEIDARNNVARIYKVEPSVVSGPKAPGEGTMDPKVVNFLNKKVAPLAAPSSETVAPSEALADASILDNMTSQQQDLGDVKTNPGFSMRTAALLGSTLYGGPEMLARVTVKEIFQNSFDAIKGLIDSGHMTQGNIAINVDPNTRAITVADDGSGIPLKVLQGPFFQVGGTHKTTQRASGGHGIAKMAFIFGNEDLTLMTVHDGVTYSIASKGSDLFDFLEKGDESKRPIIKRRTMTNADQKLFPKGHGTVIQVKLPESYIDPSTGVEKRIPIEDYDFQHPVLKNSPLLDNINVTFNGKPLEIGRAFPADQFTNLADFNFSWGTARIYVSKEEQSWGSTSILSNGLWQFDTNITKLDNPYEPIPFKYYVDVNPRVESGTPGYPFALDRQGFAPRIADDFEQIFNYVKALYQLQSFKAGTENYSDIQYMVENPDGTVSTLKSSIVPTVAPQETPLTAIKPGDKVTVKDGKFSVNGRPIPQITPDEMKSFKIDINALTVPQNKIDTTKPIIHDNTAVKISESEIRTISDMAREKYGEKYDQYIFGLGKLYLELRNGVSALMVKQFPKGSYADMKNEAVGISLDPNYRGVSIQVPFHAELVNPAGVEAMSDPVIAGVALVGTMVHELAHYKERDDSQGHGPFAAEMQRITYTLIAGDFDYHGFMQRVVDVVARNWEVQKYIHGILNSDTFDVSTRGKRLETNAELRSGAPQALSRNDAQGMGTTGQERVGGDAAILAGAPTSAIGPAAEPGRGDLASEAERAPYVTGAEPGPNAVATQRADQRLLDSEARGTPAVPRQPEVDAILDTLKPAFQAIPGGLPRPVQVQAAHASRMNRFYKWMAGLDQLVKANPYFAPLLRYAERIRLMFSEESRIHDAALRIAKRWRSLGVEGDRISGFMDDLANMTYRTPTEVKQGVKRQPVAAEVQTLRTKWNLSDEGMKVTGQIRKMFDIFLSLLEGNAIRATQRVLQNDPVALVAKINSIRAETAELRKKPYFPFLRFGRHFVMVKNAAGHVIQFETFERKGLYSAASRQASAYKAEKARRPSTEPVTFGLISEAAAPFIGMPPTLLQQIKDELHLTPDQLDALEQIQLSYTPALAFKGRMMKSNYTPGYSMDFQRAFARYFFHGGRFYARTKYGYDLRNDIKAARDVVNSNKASLIADYMDDHLQNTVLDAKGDFGIFKAGIFMWAMGYVPAAAAQNLSQTPLVTLPYLAAKFGGFGTGNVKATAAIVQAMTDVTNFYKRGYYDGQTEFHLNALGYGIKTGRISESQAAELAGLSSGADLIEGIAGNQAQRIWTWIMENGAKMFEFAEQFNRRVAFRAALDLALKNPNAKAVQEALNVYAAEYAELQQGSSTQRAFSPAEAAAIVTASYVVDQTQFIYARYARPRAMRGRLAGTLFVFKKYIQSMLFLIGQNKGDFLPQHLLMMAFLGGLGGLPGWDDFKDILRATAYWLFGKDFNLERKVREYVLATTNGKVPPDVILHGLARQGFGLPGLVDLLGSFATGTPGRGFDSKKPGQNVPFPSLDRSRAISMGNILPFEVGKMFGPMKDTDHILAEQTQKASGAVFSVGFNLYKAIMDNKHEPTDFKRWEKAIPRLFGSASRAYRAFSEGRERGTGGPDSAPTIVPFDPRDTEQMMEMLAMAAGYQPTRLQAKWDSILAKAEVTTYYDITRQGLLGQMFEAQAGKNPKEIADVQKAIREYNIGLPDWAKGKVITGDTVGRSLQAHFREKNARERGVPLQKSNVGISREMDRLFPEATVDVRKVR